LKPSQHPIRYLGIDTYDRTLEACHLAEPELGEHLAAVPRHQRLDQDVDLGAGLPSGHGVRARIVFSGISAKVGDREREIRGVNVTH
jgi:hypothetical protein